MRNRVRIRLLVLLLAALHASVLFAGFIAPYDAKEQDRNFPYTPPTRLHFNSASGFHLRPFVYAQVSDSDGYREDRTHEYPLHFFVKGSSYSLLGLFNSDCCSVDSCP
jgi:peptide/nickel transport system permease protein